MFRKGQNYRIFINGGVVAEETSCTVTRGVDTEDGMNKDLAFDSTSGDVGGQNPIPTYKNMSFQVEAQGAGAVALYLTARQLMNAQGGAVGWAETSGTANRTGTPTYKQAICNDLTLNTPNRQPVTCTAQFTVISDTATQPSSSWSPAAVTRNILRGEFVRLFLTDQTNQYIAQATNASIHLSLSLEDATTKDTQSVAGTSTEDLSYKAQEPTTINFDISSDCIYQGGLHSLTEGTTYPFKFAYATGANQQTMGDVIEQGDAMLTTLTANAPVGQNVTYNGSFTGVGLPGGTGNTSNTTEGNL